MPGQPTSLAGTNPEQITALLERAHAGDVSAANDLMPLVYDQLRRIARKHLSRERPGHTLQPTALVNEAYLRMFGNPPPEFSGRTHFIAFASRIMRRILVDHARARGSGKRGGDGQRVEWDTSITVEMPGADRTMQIMDLDLAIERLSREHPPLGEVVEMRYFGGLTAEEIAEAVGRSVHVVRHEVRFAQAWLRRELL
jgi:RNA polymerase sigma-70 factor (ECF subfamily)